jgi:hypothetical protein
LTIIEQSRRKKKKKKRERETMMKRKHFSPSPPARHIHRCYPRTRCPYSHAGTSKFQKITARLIWSWDMEFDFLCITSKKKANTIGKKTEN